MSDREASMRTAKRHINTEKHERVTAVIAQIKDDLRSQLRDTEEALEAARRLNPTLICERSSGATERQR